MSHLRIQEMKEFSADPKVRRKKLFTSEKIVAEFVSYEPGQGAVVHFHPKQDEIFYVVEGKGIILVGDEEIQVQPSSVVFVPAQVKHGIKTTEDSQLVIMFVKGPGSTKVAAEA